MRSLLFALFLIGSTPAMADEIELYGIKTGIEELTFTDAKKEIGDNDFQTLSSSEVILICNFCDRKWSIWIIDGGRGFMDQSIMFHYENCPKRRK